MSRIWRLYRWHDASGALLYLGITNDPERREQEHRARSWWTRFADTFTVDTDFTETTSSRASVREAELIWTENPVFNGSPVPDPRGRALAYLAAQGVDWVTVGHLLPAPRASAARGRSRGLLTDCRYLGHSDLVDLLAVSRTRVEQIVKTAGFPETHYVGAKRTRVWERDAVRVWAEQKGRVLHDEHSEHLD